MAFDLASITVGTHRCSGVRRRRRQSVGRQITSAFDQQQASLADANEVFSRLATVAMKLRHATLVDVIGRAERSGGFTFVPAELDLDGSSLSPSFPLAASLPEPVPPVLLAAVAGNYDAAWVVGRLSPTFGFMPDLNPGEKTLFQAGFVALPDAADEAAAFYCCDFYGETSLMFSDLESDERLKERVAAAFWGLLLLEPESLQDFEGKVLHLGAPVTLRFGCQDGEPYCYEVPY